MTGTSNFDSSPPSTVGSACNLHHHALFESADSRAYSPIRAGAGIKPRKASGEPLIERPSCSSLPLWAGDPQSQASSCARRRTPCYRATLPLPHTAFMRPRFSLFDAALPPPFPIPLRRRVAFRHFINHYRQLLHVLLCRYSSISPCAKIIKLKIHPHSANSPTGPDRRASLIRPGILSCERNRDQQNPHLGTPPTSITTLPRPAQASGASQAFGFLRTIAPPAR